MVYFAAAFCIATAGFLGWFIASRQRKPTVSQNDLTVAVPVEPNQQLETLLAVASDTLGNQLASGKYVIERERQLISEQVAGVADELNRVSALVETLRKEKAEQSGQLNASLQHATKTSTVLLGTTQSLQKALASPKARGMWGERTAEDILLAAGFVEGVNFVKQKKIAAGTVPDFSFLLPKEQLLHMDVKFPADNYLRWLEARDAATRKLCIKSFKYDVRQRIKELTGRGYSEAESTVGYLLLFIPNESIYGFLHEHDSELIDFALKQKVVLCSPTSLFAVLAVVRQTIDTFSVEQKSAEILDQVEALRQQWDNWAEPLEKMRRGLDSAQKAFDELAGPRFRQVDRQIVKLENSRRLHNDVHTP